MTEETQAVSQPGPARLDTAKLESELKKALSVSTTGPVVGAPGVQQQGILEVRSVTCPPRIEERKGETFTCEVKAINRSGLGKDFPQSGTVRVIEEDGEGGVRYRARMSGKGLTITIRGKLRL